MAGTNVVPKPPAFLDPLTEVDSCMFYAVPKFCPMDHANTHWLLNIMRNCNVDRMKRKMELRPDMFHSNYYQVLDHPSLYHCRDPSVHSLFHRQAVLYLTAVGVAIYLRSKEILRLLFEYRDPRGEKLFKIDDPQYATHVQDIVGGDFHSYPVSLVMIRGGFFEAAPDLLAAGWNPRETICLPLRRRYERRAIYHHDWLDYTLCLIHDKPMLPISKLVHCMICEPQVRNYAYLPMTVVKPASEGERVATGFMEVEDLPEDARMSGTKSLLDIAEDYSVYLQIRERHKLVKACIGQMVSDGVNPEITMATALDYDGGYEELDEDTVAPNKAASNSFMDASNANNNATTGKKKKNTAQDIAESAYASEPTRILLHAERTDPKPFDNTPLRPLLDAVAVYIRFNFYVIHPPPIKKKKGREGNNKSQEKQYALQKRDAKNAVILLLNLMQIQFDKLDWMNEALRDVKPKFTHLDVYKQAHNKRVMIMRNVRRIGDLLFNVLLHSGEFLHFVQASFPPYSHVPGGQADFAANPSLEPQLRAIQMEAMTEFSKSKTAPAFLDIAGLEKATKIKELFLNLRFGPRPTQEEISNSVGRTRRSVDEADSLNASNLTIGAPPKGAVTIAQRHSNNKASSDRSLCKRPARGSEGCLRDVIGQASNTGGRVTFVKVKRRRRHAEPVGGEGAVEEVANTGRDLAFKLANQIADLGRHAEDGTDVTQKLVDIYQLILGDLSKIPSVREVLNNAAFAEIEEADLEADPERAGGEEVLPELRTEASKVEGGSPSGHAEEASHRRQHKHQGLSGGGGRRKIHRSGLVRTGARRARHQNARVFDAPLDGTEFAVDHP